MKYKVVKKQYTTRNCFVCGEKNRCGVRARFYELDNGEVAGIFKAPLEHSGYPGRMHGGVLSAIIDEAIGRSILISEPDAFAVTMELSTQFKKPVPVCRELKVIGRLTSVNGRVFEGTGEILLENGEVAVTGSAKYLKIPLEKIAGESFNEDTVLHTPDGVTEIEL
ncbi:MAG: PaaI family thioesterase [Clostridiaceae bacterium]